MQRLTNRRKLHTVYAWSLAACIARGVHHDHKSVRANGPPSEHTCHYVICCYGSHPVLVMGRCVESRNDVIADTGACDKTDDGLNSSTRSYLIYYVLVSHISEQKLVFVRFLLKK